MDDLRLHGVIRGGIKRKGDNVALASEVSGTTLKLVPPKGIYDGETAKVTITDANFLESNIVIDKNVFGVNGIFDGIEKKVYYPAWEINKIETKVTEKCNVASKDTSNSSFWISNKVMVVDSVGDLYAIANGTHNVYKFNPNTGATIWSQQNIGGLTNVNIGSAGIFIYDNQIWIIYTKSSGVLRIAKLNMTTGLIIEDISFVNKFMYAAISDGIYIYLLSGDNYIYKYLLSTLTLVQSSYATNYQERPTGLTIGNGKVICAGQNKSNGLPTITIRNTSDLSLVAILYPRFEPDATYEFKVCSLDTDGERIIAVGDDCNVSVFTIYGGLLYSKFGYGSTSKFGGVIKGDFFGFWDGSGFSCYNLKDVPVSSIGVANVGIGQYGYCTLIHPIYNTICSWMRASQFNAYEVTRRII